ncbi:hypothetical protein JOF41_005370 [Saccharothrix coeruleofusca]|uniref:hypothetical protein n=1 Tax=Saccharothrix coeruleofusca TaxID=33919 RepID=UPI001AEAFA6C|nr:hypothetical protein [Saccharothrix coeruleofusca]MBP2339192.1 hypothetical protein [Saccharothrix coeruleofusca]
MSQPQGPSPAFDNPRDARAQARADKAYRKAQRPWYKKKRFILLLALLAIVVIVAVNVSGGDDKPTAQEPGAQPAFAGATADDVVAKAGETVDADGVRVTTTQLVPGDKTFGNTLCTTVTYTSQSDQPSNFSGATDWKMQDPNGAILFSTITGSKNLLQSGQLAPGGNTTGDVCFNAPQGTPPGQYVVLLEPFFRFSSDRIAWLNTL